ncbi:hypothetical protein ACC706_37660, partial [Rhizobium johnstonii]
MVSTALASTLARRNIHYGWVVVSATFLTMLVTAGAMGAPGVLIKPNRIRRIARAEEICEVSQPN